MIIDVFQKSWDTPVVNWNFAKILDHHSSDPRAKAHLLACQLKESSAWITAPPVFVSVSV